MLQKLHPSPQNGSNPKRFALERGRPFGIVVTQDNRPREGLQLTDGMGSNLLGGPRLLLAPVRHLEGEHSGSFRHGPAD
jgi:hypothetical protein